MERVGIQVIYKLFADIYITFWKENTDVILFFYFPLIYTIFFLDYERMSVKPNTANVLLLVARFTLNPLRLPKN